MQPDYDVLIIGGGFVGTTLALSLNHAPLRVGLIEATALQIDITPPGYDDRGLVLAPISKRIFQGLGLWDRLKSYTTPIHQIHVSDRGYFGFTRLHKEDIGFDALGYVVVGRTLGQVLIEQLHSQRNLTLFSPARVIQIQNATDQITVSVDVHGESLNLSTRLLIAADGGSSDVRRLLNIDVEEFDYHQTAIVANVTTERPHYNTAYERFTENGPLAFIPLTERKCVTVHVVDSESVRQFLEMNEESYLQILIEKFGYRLGRLNKLGNRRSYPLKLIKAQKLTGPRYVIIGNAAHTIHPNAAQGLNLGLRDVAELGHLILTFSRKNMDIGSNELLDLYKNARATDHARTINLSNGLTQIFYNDFIPLAITRNLAMLTIDRIPFLKRRLIKNAMGLNTLSNSPLMRGMSL